MARPDSTLLGNGPTVTRNHGLSPTRTALVVAGKPESSLKEQRSYEYEYLAYDEAKKFWRIHHSTIRLLMESYYDSELM